MFATLHTQPVKGELDVAVEKQAGHVSTGLLPLVLIGVAWKVPLTHAVHAMLDDTVPAEEKYSPADGHCEDHGAQEPEPVDAAY